MTHYKKFLYLSASIFSFFLVACSQHSHEEDEHEDHAETHALVIEPEKAKRFGIDFETVSLAPFSHIIKTSGAIEASSSDTYTVTAKQSGIVTLASGIAQGAEVKSGEKIATISPEGVQGGNVNQAASANLQAAKAEYERLKPLYEEKLITASTFREAERAYNEARALASKPVSGSSFTLTSPIQGSLTNLFVKSGEYVEVGTPVASVAKNTTQILRADLPMREGLHVSEIESANFIPEGSNEVLSLKTLDGKIISGQNATGLKNGYIPVFFSFTGNPFSAPGGFAEVFLICRAKKDAVSVPNTALIESQGNRYVYVVEHGEHYEKRLVKTGSSDGKRIEILEGLQPGEQIVAKGASIVRMEEVSAVAPPSHTHNH